SPATGCKVTVVPSCAVTLKSPRTMDAMVVLLPPSGGLVMCAARWRRLRLGNVVGGFVLAPHGSAGWPGHVGVAERLRRRARVSRARRRVRDGAGQPLADAPNDLVVADLAALLALEGRELNDTKQLDVEAPVLGAPEPGAGARQVAHFSRL